MKSSINMVMLVVLLTFFIIPSTVSQTSEELLIDIPFDTSIPSNELIALNESANNISYVSDGICGNLFFSTEEDFLTRGPAPPDGNPIISDGDLLRSGCVLFARNRELLKYFQAEQDLGLDAADVIDEKRPLVAFSTELDDPRGRFTAGDLLTTNGAIIPNAALLARFDVPRIDLGLDAVHFVGDLDRIIKFLDSVSKVSSDEWRENPDRLLEMLNEYDIDIWFSTEGTSPNIRKPFLDGDLLSARAGIIIARNAAMLPASVPAGIPVRGVDFGLDAITGSRDGDRKSIYFSTEILYEGRPSFTDGDVLLYGNGVICNNDEIIRCFEPKTKELGLDALSISGLEMENVAHITDFNGVAVGAINSSGLANLPDEPFGFGQPFGRWIEIKGFIPDDISEYRVVYCKAEDWPCSETDIDGIEIKSTADWHVDEAGGLIPCEDNTRHWFSDAEGWFNASDYRDLVTPCNPGLPLTMWNSNALSDPNGLYVVWLQYNRSGMIYDEPWKHFIQLDNIEPKNLSIKPKGGNFCDNLTSDQMPLMVQGHFDDKHFWRYGLEISGGDPSHTKTYLPVNYYDDPADGIDSQGTGPGMVDLYEVDVNDLPAESIDDCCYAVTLYTWDRTIWCSFRPTSDARHLDTGLRNKTATFTFAYTP